MTRPTRLLTLLPALLSLLAASAAPLLGQDPDARVAPAGVLRVEVGGTFAAFGERFGAPEVPGSDGRFPASTPFSGRLTTANFAPLQTLQTRVAALLTATGGAAGAPVPGPETLFLEAGRINGRANWREVPLRLEVGVLPRISIAARGALTQHRLEVTGFGIGRGTVGVNPDPAGNAELLAAVDTAFRALGAGRFLPTADSPLGRALQGRVGQAAGRQLALPTTPAGVVSRPGLADEAQLALRTGAYDPARPLWSIADTEVAARVQLIDTPGSLTPGGAPGAGFRASAEAGIRLPTGRRPTADFFLLPPPEEGISGWNAGLAAELLASPRLSAHASGRWERLSEVELLRPIWGEDDELPPARETITGRWSPGTRLTVEASPRFHVVDEIALFGRYVLSRRSGERFDGLEALELGGAELQRTAQAWGVGAQFSTLPAVQRGITRIPFEARIQMLSTFAGRDGAPALRMVEMQGRAFVRLWGEEPR